MSRELEIFPMADNTNPQLNTERVRELLSPYLDGEVTDEERKLVEQAVAASPELHRELETLRQMVNLVTSLPQVPAPRPFTLSEVDVQAVSPAPRRVFGLPAWAGGLAVAAAALVCVLAAGGLYFGRQFGSAPQAELARVEQQAAQMEAPAEETAPAEEAAPAAPAAKAEAVETESVAEAERAGEEGGVENEKGEAEDRLALTGEAAGNAASVAGETETTQRQTVTEAEASKNVEADNAAGAVGAVAPTSGPLPTPTAAALAAPATEIVGEEAMAEAAAAPEQPAAAEAESPLKPAEEQGQQVEQKELAPGPVEIQTATPAPTATLPLPSPTPLPTPTVVARLTALPTATPTIPLAPSSSETAPRVPLRIVGAGVAMLGILVIIGLIIWFIIHHRNSRAS